MFSNRWRLSKKFFLLFSFFLIAFFGARILSNKFHTLLSFFHYLTFPSQLPVTTFVKEEHLVSGTATPWAPMFSHLYSCPVCFGYGMCNEVMKDSVLFHGELSMAHNTKIMWKKGVLRTQRILISSLVSEEWNKFDEFICRNASQTIPCDLSAAIWKTVFANSNLLSTENFRNLNALLDIPLSQLALPVCSSTKLLSELTKSFDENFDGHFSGEEKILLLTSLVMQPGYVILKLQAKTKMTMPIPNLLGACGRSVILEGGLKPLKSFLSESFDARAGLAIQVLQLVEDFENMHEFSCLLPVISFSLDGIFVTKEGEVVVMDLDNIVILDKSSFTTDSFKLSSRKGLCNEVCFQKITLELLYYPNNSSCNFISEYGLLMYAVVCKQVLSNIAEHRAEGFFNFDGHRIHRKQENPGLLHSIPHKIKERMEDLLRECVQETKLNGRKKAITELRDMLENYVNINDSNGHSTYENTPFWTYKKNSK